MSEQQKNSPKLLGIIKAVHGFVEKQDLDEKRQAQINLGNLYTRMKDISVAEFEIDGTSAEWITVNRAHMKKYVILYCHGGGYMSGSKEYARAITYKLARSTSMDVLCFDYRLAPEHPFPAATEDVVKIWDYLMLLGYGARDIIVAGDSAGGNLALTLLHHLKAEGRLLPRGLALLSPWTDLTCQGQSHQINAELDPVLDAEYMKQAIEHYAKNQELSNPMISPLFGDFKGFPPTYIQVGEYEILYDDSKKLYEVMMEANVSVQFCRFPKMWHVFQMSPFKTAYDAMEEIAEFIFKICR